MKREDIIQLAREAAEATNTIVPPEGPLFVTPFIECFAALVAARERGRCIDIANEWDAPIVAFEINKLGTKED